MQNTSTTDQLKSGGAIAPLETPRSVSDRCEHFQAQQIIYSEAILTARLLKLIAVGGTQ
jgi:hypothetical protein